MRERFRGDSCGESQPLILYVVYLQVGRSTWPPFALDDIKKRPLIMRGLAVYRL